MLVMFNGLKVIKSIDSSDSPVEHVPEELCEEGEPELGGDVCDVLDVGDLQLLLDGERVQEVAAEDDRVGRGVHRVDPPVDEVGEE